MLAPPRADQFPVADRESPAIHGAGVQLPCAGALFDCLGYRLAIANAQRVEVARPIDDVPPHHRELAWPERYQGRVAAFADRTAGSLIQHYVLLPGRPGIVAERAPQALSSGDAIVKPGGGHVTLFIRCHRVEPFPSRFRLIVNDGGLRPSPPAVRGAPVEKVAF